MLLTVYLGQRVPRTEYLKAELSSNNHANDPCNGSMRQSTSAKSEVKTNRGGFNGGGTSISMEENGESFREELASNAG